MSDAQHVLDGLYATYATPEGTRMPVGGEHGRLQDGRENHAAQFAMSIASSWCADPKGIEAMIAAGAPFMFEPKAGESEAAFTKRMKSYARKVAKSAAKKGTADKTREAVARQEAAREIGALLDAEADKVGAVDKETWSAWETARKDPVGRVIEGIPPVAWLPGLEGIIPKGSDSVVAAAFKVGKTFLCGVAWMMTLTLAGVKVLIVDTENGEIQYARRIDEVKRAWALSDADLEKIRANLDYREFPDITGNLKKGDAGDAARFAEKAVAADVVIFDSAAGLLERFGVEENDNDLAKALHRLIMEPLKRAGVTVLTLANSGYGDPERMRGASAWHGAFEGIYSLSGDAFSANVASDVTLKCKRSRDGVLGEWIWRMGGGSYVGPIEKSEAQKPIPVDFKQQAERIVMRAGKAMTLRELRAAIRTAGVKFSDVNAGLWLDRLSCDPDSTLVKEGKGFTFQREVE